jgi:hypothetical protein
MGIKAVKFVVSLLFGILVLFFTNSVYALPVIPDAAGYGMDTSAGRGGKVYKVTSLEDNNIPGTLRYAISQSGPRVVIFEVSGTIKINNYLDINDPYITIAGQTAPSPGIFLRGANIRIMTHDVLIQHIRVAPGDEAYSVTPTNRDAVAINGSTERPDNIVIDHSTFTWTTDELFGTWGPYGNVTFRHVIGSEPLHDSIHVDEGQTEPVPHGFGPLFDNQPGSKVTLSGSLMSHAHGRQPMVMAEEYVDVNNVYYDRGQAFHLINTQRNIPTQNSIVGNVFKEGPSVEDWAVDNAPLLLYPQFALGGKLYLNDNISVNGGWSFNSQWDLIQNNTSPAQSQEQLEADEPPAWNDGLIVKPTEEVFDWVMASAGARPADRLPYETRIINQAKNGTGAIVDSIAEAGGWPVVAENHRSLVIPKNPGTDSDGDGYTNLEEWLETYSAFVEGRGAEPPLIDPADGEPEDDQEPETTPAIISNLVVNPTAQGAESWLVMSNLQEGNITYSDRAFKFDYVPPIVAGSSWIMGAANSKAYTGNDPLSTFKVDTDADVYVAFDHRLTPLPAWMIDSGWINTGESFIINEALPFDLYKKSYTAGSTVTLGQNGNKSNLLYITLAKDKSAVANGTTAITAPADGTTISSLPEVISGTAVDLDTNNKAISDVFVSIQQNSTHKYLNPATNTFDELDSAMISVYDSYDRDFGTWMLDVAHVPFTNGSYTVTARVYDGAVGASAESSFTIAILDKSILDAAITDAQAIHDAAIPGTKPGQYPQGAKEALMDAIQAAQAVVNNGSVTQTEVNEAVAALETAVGVFQAKVIERMPEDVNGDGEVNVIDLLTVISHFGKNSSSHDWDSVKASDVNGDQKVNAADLKLVAIKMRH